MPQPATASVRHAKQPFAGCASSILCARAVALAEHGYAGAALCLPHELESSSDATSRVIRLKLYMAVTTQLRQDSSAAQQC